MSGRAGSPKYPDGVLPPIVRPAWLPEAVTVSPDEALEGTIEI